MRFFFFTACSFASRTIAALGGAFLSIVVGRAAGPEGLGIVAVFVSLVTVSCILARRGMDMLIVRETAKAMHSSESGRLPGLLVIAAQKTLVGSVFALALAFGMIWLGVLGPSLPHSTIVLLVAVPVLSLLAVVSGHLKGLRLTAIAPFFEIGGWSLLSAVLLSTLSGFGGFSYHALVSFSLAAGAALLALFGGAAILVVWKSIPILQTSLGGSAAKSSSVFVGQFDFTVTAVTSFLVQAGAFLVAAPFLTDNDIGLLRAAERFALIVSFPALVIRPMIMASIVTNVKSGDTARLRRLLIQAGLAGGSLGLVPLAVMLFNPAWTLRLIGPEFVGAAPFLQILAGVHFLVVVLSPLGTLLNMGGSERLMMWIAIGTFVVALALFPVLSIWYDAIGFLVAYSIAVMLRLVLITAFAFRKLLQI